MSLGSPSKATEGALLFCEFFMLLLNDFLNLFESFLSSSAFLSLSIAVNGWSNGMNNGGTIKYN
jgi:hypothetical protein